MTDKVKVSTTGDFMLLDPVTGEVVEAYGVSEVTKSAFIQSQLDLGKLTTSAKPKSEPEPVEEKEVLTPAAQVTKVKT